MLFVNDNYVKVHHLFHGHHHLQHIVFYEYWADSLSVSEFITSFLWIDSLSFPSSLSDLQVLEIRSDD